MEFESIKRLGLDHYNIDLVKSYEAYDSIHDNHIIFIHLNKDDRVYCPCCGSITFISKGTKSSEFKYSSSLEKNIIIKLYRHVYKCQDCGRLFKEENPFTQTKKRITIQKDIQ